MILFWALCAAMTLITLAALLMPLLRSGRKPASTDDDRRGLAVLKDQIEEIERDRARGLLDEEQAKAARLEVERRLLAIADREVTGTTARKPGTVGGRSLAVMLGLAVPAAALALYVGLGAPGEPSQPFAEREGVAPARDMAELAESLSQRLARGEGGPDDWALLARTYSQLDRPAQAAQAAAEAIRLGHADAETHSFYGEMLVAAAEGTVTPEARQAFGRALELDRGNPRALYYAGLALAQDGQLQPAMEVWTNLAEASPPTAPWMTLLRRQLQRVAGELGVEPPSVAMDQAPAGMPSESGDATAPSQADIAAAQDLTPEERMAFIRSMVAGLAERLEGSPDDLDGWLRLTRAYMVLQERDKANAALARAEALTAALPADAPERAAVAAARRALGGDG